MTDAFRRPRGTTAAPSKRPGSSLLRPHCGLRLAAWFVLPALLLPAVGCAKKPKESAVVADAEPAAEEEKPAEVVAPVAKKKKKGAEKPAAAQPPAASTNDISKWEVADLDAALARKDLLFVPAVVLYGVRNPGDAKRANALDALVRQVARMKDDPTIPLALPPNAFGGANKSPAGSSATPSVAKPAAKSGTKPLTPLKDMRFNIGGK
jgi:hypothetical protein